MALDIDKIAGRATIIVPVVHLVACGLYMAGYSIGFGGNIGGMFSASDFFTITIQHLITTYVLTLGMPLVVIFMRHRSGRTYAVDLIAREDDPLKKAELIATRHWVVGFTTWTLPVLALLALVMLACQFWTGAARDYYFALNMCILALFPSWWKIANHLKFYGLSVELAWCALAFTVGVVGLGMNSGERDRRYSYNDLSEGRMRCGKHVILSPIGNRFISVTPDNRRHLVNDECKVQFDFVPTTIVPFGSLYDLVIAKLVVAPSMRAAPLPKLTPRTR